MILNLIFLKIQTILSFSNHPSLCSEFIQTNIQSRPKNHISCNAV